jgi:hypothetical protein
MDTYKAALHKDVSAIFDGVWEPQEDSDFNQQSFDLPDLSDLAKIQPSTKAKSIQQPFKEPVLSTPAEEPELSRPTEEPMTSRPAFVEPRVLPPDRIPFPRVIRLRQPKVSAIRKFFTFGDIFSSRARRERRRLSSISRHLLINMTSS